MMYLTYFGIGVLTGLVLTLYLIFIGVIVVNRGGK
jgi:hypothetical protein